MATNATNVDSLLAALRRTLWRHSLAPERLRHIVDERGDHAVLLTLTRDEVDYHPPFVMRPGHGGAHVTRGTK